MDDLISRQQAIDALAELARERFTIQDCFQIYLDALTDADKKIQQLPPAQPEPPEECERCMMEHTDEMEKLEAELAIAKSKQPEPCEDAVSREKVKELAYSQIRSEYSGIALKEQREAMLRIADNVIGLLPSVTPKQRTGKWIKCGWAIKCSECDYDMPFTVRNFCPNCGAKMEVTI